jgi:hypothetical protein
MPRKTLASRPRRQPSCRLHKARNCAVVTIHGKNHYLGPYDSPESLVNAPAWMLASTNSIAAMSRWFGALIDLDAQCVIWPETLHLQPVYFRAGGWRWPHQCDRPGLETSFPTAFQRLDF